MYQVLFYHHLIGKRKKGKNAVSNKNLKKAHRKTAFGKKHNNQTQSNAILLQKKSQTLLCSLSRKN